MRPILIFVLVFVMLPILSMGQQLQIQGKVTDEKKNPLPGVTVIIKGTSAGTITDFDGLFTIKAKPGDSLVFSMMGMIPQQIAIVDNRDIQVALIEDLKQLDEVVVIGYGTVRKSDLTGAVGSVKAKDLVKITALNPIQNLQGKVSGVQVTSTTGAPGAKPIVRVRGVGTFNNSSPIYVVDGVILDDISFLNSADIASMEILKDASATAIYGSRGSNGVILVTTKSGSSKNGKATFNYSGEVGNQKLAKKIDLLTGKEFAIVSNQIQNGSYNNVDVLPNTDWQDLVFHDARVSSHQLSASGSSEKTQYYLGLGYFNQEGIVDKSSYERFSFKINNTYQLNDFIKAGNNLSFTPYKQQNAPNVTYQVYRAWPLLEPYRPDGSYAGVPGVGNPLADLANSNDYNKGIRAVGNLFTEVSILKNFTFKSSFGVDAMHNKSTNYTPAFNILYYDGSQSMQSNPTSDLTKGTADNFTWLWENTLNYSRTVEKHSLNAVIGYTMQNSSSEYTSLTGENIIRDGQDFWYLKPGNIQDTYTSLVDNVDENLNYSMISYLFRANYTYNNRYIFTVTYRRDGSSKFAKQNRFSYFPSIALGWNISEEEFMKQFGWLSNLKLRTSWGKIGNEKIAYTNRFSMTQNSMAVFGKDDASFPGVTYAKNGNPDLKWETTTQTDIGLEIGLLDGKLSGEFDYYNRVTDDILVELSTPGHVGNGQGQKVRYNAGSVLNRGVEANIIWRDQLGDLKYSLGFLATTVHNEVLSVGGNSGVDSLLMGGNIKGFVTQTREGLPIGSFYGYKTNGLFQTADELAAYPHSGDATVGSLRRVDTNNDGVINGKDRTNLGSPIPTFIYGFNIDLEYKNFDFSMNIQGQYGNKIFNGKEIVRPDKYNFEKHVLDAWTGPGTSNSEPAPSWGGYNYEPSDKYVQDGSFVRLRNLIIGYTLPANFSSKLKIDKLRVYVKGDNIYTRSNFTGYTPEIASEDVLSNAIDMGAYPVCATYSFGINITF